MMKLSSNGKTQWFKSLILELTILCIWKEKFRKLTHQENSVCKNSQKGGDNIYTTKTALYSAFYIKNESLNFGTLTKFRLSLFFAPQWPRGISSPSQ